MYKICAISPHIYYLRKRYKKEARKRKGSTPHIYITFPLCQELLQILLIITLHTMGHLVKLKTVLVFGIWTGFGSINNELMTFIYQSWLPYIRHITALLKQEVCTTARYIHGETEAHSQSWGFKIFLRSLLSVL